MTTTTTPRQVRSRTPEEEALLLPVKRYQTLVKVRVSLGNQLWSACDRGLFGANDPEMELDKDVAKVFAARERYHIKIAAKIVKEMPIYKEWLKHVRGIGDNLAAQFCAHLQPISDFPNVAKLWAYAGMHVIDGVGARRMEGVRANWNSHLKTLCYQAGECFVKSGGYYRQWYDQFKAQDRAKHPEKLPDGKTKKGKPKWKYTDKHIHNRAMRKTSKLFLSHLWEAWRTIEGLPVRGPYVKEYMGHTTVSSPWDAIATPAKTNEAAVAVA